MIAKRIIAALDVMNGKVVKGVRFKDIRDAGDPAELAARYEDEGADEIVFLDITASHEGRKTASELASRVSEYLGIPFTVGGGIGSVEEASAIIKNGADKIFVNTAALLNRSLVNGLAATIGSSNIVVAVDSKLVNGRYEVFSHGGRVPAGIDLLSWAMEVENRGAGEILLTSMDRDGTGLGFDTEMVKSISSSINIPVIASGGAGRIEDFLNIFRVGAQAALGASVFHFGKFGIGELKEFLLRDGVNVRL